MYQHLFCYQELKIFPKMVIHLFQIINKFTKKKEVDDSEWNLVKYLIELLKGNFSVRNVFIFSTLRRSALSIKDN